MDDPNKAAVTAIVIKRIVALLLSSWP